MGVFDDLIPAGATAGRGGVPTGIGTPKIRADALADYNRAMQLGAVIQDIETKFKAGPGATKGLEGLMDYLPLPRNQVFDAASNQLRGFVKGAQGMTGGEVNTAAEMKLNIAPFIPSSSDYDEVVEQKIAALRRERDRAMQTSIATMGGTPDVNGRITPVAPVQRGMIGGGSRAPAAPASDGWSIKPKG